MHVQTEDFEKSEELLQLCLTLCQEMKHERGITHTYNALANVAYERVSKFFSPHPTVYVRRSTFNFPKSLLDSNHYWLVFKKVIFSVALHVVLHQD